MARVLCGNCKEYHVSARAVYQCFQKPRNSEEITDLQAQYIRGLADSRLSPEEARALKDKVPFMSKRDAGETIDRLKKTPRLKEG